MCFVCGGVCVGGGGGGGWGLVGEQMRFVADSHLLGEKECARFAVLTSGDGSVGRRFIGEDDVCRVSIISVKSASQTRLFDFMGDISSAMVGCSSIFILHHF
jgi:hypothetical protein